MWGETILAAEGKWSLVAVALITMGVAGLSCGYLYGTKYCDSIWAICAISTSSIVIVEPLLAYMYFNTVPCPRVLVGLLLGTVGLLITIK